MFKEVQCLWALTVATPWSLGCGTSGKWLKISSPKSRICRDKLSVTWTFVVRWLVDAPQASGRNVTLLTVFSTSTGFAVHGWTVYAVHLGEITYRLPNGRVSSSTAFMSFLLSSITRCTCGCYQARASNPLRRNRKPVPSNPFHSGPTFIRNGCRGADPPQNPVSGMF